ncbi:hypothetical protein GOBAR_DD31610 [Gossypium barbadense]|nr:hypothetical protein GOBAR_DD31610 [Gossypium barbadense]
MSRVSVDRGSIELELNGEGVRLEPELEGERVSGPTKLNKETIAASEVEGVNTKRVSSDISEDANEDEDDSDFQSNEPKEKKKNRSVGVEDLELVVNLSGLQKDKIREVNGEGIGDETDYIGSDDVGSYDSDSNGQELSAKLNDAHG